MPKDLKTLQNEFQEFETKFVVLLVNEKTILARDKKREENCQMGPRCLVLLQEFKDAAYSEKYILDTSKLSVEETVNEILNEKRFQTK